MAYLKDFGVYRAACRFYNLTRFGAEEKDFGLPEINDPKASGGHNENPYNEKEEPEKYYKWIKNIDSQIDELHKSINNQHSSNKEKYEAYTICSDLSEKAGRSGESFRNMARRCYMRDIVDKYFPSHYLFSLTTGNNPELGVGTAKIISKITDEQEIIHIMVMPDGRYTIKTDNNEVLKEASEKDFNLPEIIDPKASENPDLYYEGLSEKQKKEKDNRLAELNKLQDKAWTLSSSGKHKEAYETWMVLRDHYLDIDERKLANDAMTNGLDDLARHTAVETWKRPEFIIQDIKPWDTYKDGFMSGYYVYLAQKKKTVDGWRRIDNTVKYIKINVVDGSPKIRVSDDPYNDDI